MRFSPAPVAALAAVLLGGCEPTASLVPDPTGISASVTDGPEMPGHSHLIRLGVPEWTISTSDPDAEMFTIYGDPTQIFDCGGPGGPEYSVQFNELELAMGRMRNLLAQGSAIDVYVYDFFTEEDRGDRTFCEYFAEEWKYRGTVEYAEMFHRNLIENNTAWHWNANGTVQDVDGKSYVFHESQLFRRAANGNAAEWLKEHIAVTPLGNQ
ncbi:MAG TPA: hypothetical protein VJ992_00835 [Gemmatimonadales bacterium]|nr:hypothetical protein [Gemmatimonadales bacterium]